MSDIQEKLNQFVGLKLKEISLTDDVLVMAFDLDEDPNTDSLTRLVLTHVDEDDIRADP